MSRTERILLLMSDEQYGVREAIALTTDEPDGNPTTDETTHNRSNAIAPRSPSHYSRINIQIEVPAMKYS